MPKSKTLRAVPKVNVNFVRDDCVSTFIKDPSSSYTRSRTRYRGGYKEADGSTQYYHRVRQGRRFEINGDRVAGCQLENEENNNNENIENMVEEVENGEAEAAKDNAADKEKQSMERIEANATRGIGAKVANKLEKLPKVGQKLPKVAKG